MRLSIMMLSLVAGCAHAGAAETTSVEPDRAHHAHHGDGYDKDFSSVEAYAARFDAEDRDAWQKPRDVVGLLELLPGASVADIGAGTGYFLGHLSKAVGQEGRVLGLDVEPNMVRHMRERAAREGWTNVVAGQVPFDDPDLAADSVDRVLIVNTWHHISGREAYAARLKDGLREGGFVLIVDFTKESDQGPPPEYRLTAQQVVAELEAGGLAAAIVDESLPKQYAVLARKPAL